jgi:exportin-7
MSSVESLAQLEVLCEKLYNSRDSAERAHAESTLKCFSENREYISQCQYILDNASTPYSLMLASSSLLKQVSDRSLSLQLRLDIRNVSFCKHNEITSQHIVKFLLLLFCFILIAF